MDVISRIYYIYSSYIRVCINVAPSSSPSNAFPVLDRTEDYGAGQRVKEHEEEHAEYDKEALANGHADRQHQHLESGVLAGDGEEPEDHDHESEHVGEIFLKAAARMIPS